MPPADSRLPAELSDEQFCYVTTTGRKTGRPHEIEIWFVARGESVFLMSGGGERADWVKNINANRDVRVRIGEAVFEARGEVAPDEKDEIAVRERMAAKYQGWRPGGELSEWARNALLVRIDLDLDGPEVHRQT